ncbi:MAG: cytochrome c1 [Methylococcaceae bacterium]|nr:cytochrome c1 [Methylococcaceae bacterium]MCI0732961.1 cytochrome c1 [Methylococcaceae bacterium]
MKKFIGIFLLLGSCCGVAWAGVELDSVEIDLDDKASLKRGGQLFASYCQSCHSAKHMRYSRIAADLGLNEDEVSRDLMIGPKTINDSMTTAMDVIEASEWFLGIGPPDLSLVARSRGSEWLYTYLRGFYLDEARPFGVNNLVYKDVAMPNVFWEIQGLQKAVFKNVDGKPVFDTFESVQNGRMSKEQFDRAVTDLVNFLVYVGEPAKPERVRFGKYVILFLLIFLVLAYRLKKEYWKDVH